MAYQDRLSGRDNVAPRVVSKPEGLLRSAEDAMSSPHFEEFGKLPPLGSQWRNLHPKDSTQPDSYRMPTAIHWCSKTILEVQLLNVKEKNTRKKYWHCIGRRIIPLHYIVIQRAWSY